MTLSEISFETRFSFIAVFNIPTPIGFVKINLSPTLAVAFDNTFSGWTIPDTERPYLGSLSSTVWPPTKERHFL